ncbi:IS5 family transposase ISOt6 [Orientia tsutsugamushi]|nr:IS5 family transposase ISOt6 [Orientia tsutsugamushi]
MITDTGYQSIQKIHNNSELPKKKSKNNPLTKNDKMKTLLTPDYDKRKREKHNEKVLQEIIYNYNYAIYLNIISINNGLFIAHISTSISS